MKSQMISVALPVYNGADYISAAIDSILSQSFTNFEIVISDNASTDETHSILSRYANEDSRIHVNRSETFLPQVANVNRAISLCTSEWIKPFCHDDIMQPGCLESLSKCLLSIPHENVGLIGHSEEWLFANGYRSGSSNKVPQPPQYLQGRAYIQKHLLGKAPSGVGLPALTNSLVRKKAWLELGQFDSRYIYFDTFLWTRLLMYWDYIYVADALTVNRIHGAQVAVGARKQLRFINEYSTFIQEYLNEFSHSLAINRKVLLRMHVKRLVFASNTIAAEIIKWHFTNAFQVFFSLPAHWWLIMPFITLHSLLKEHHRIRPLRQHVPTSLIYPD